MESPLLILLRGIIEGFSASGQSNLQKPWVTASLVGAGVYCQKELVPVLTAAVVLAGTLSGFCVQPGSSTYSDSAYDPTISELILPVYALCDVLRTTCSLSSNNPPYSSHNAHVPSIYG